jgi:putative transposase
VIKVDPKYTSQTCSKCDVIDALSRFGEKFVCTSCGHETHADKQAAINIKNKAISENELVIKKIKKVRPDWSEPETPSVEPTTVKRRQHRARNSERDVPGNPPKLN